MSRPSSANGRPPSVNERPPSAKSRPPSVNERPPSAKSRPPSVNERPPSAKSRPLSSRSRPPSAKSESGDHPDVAASPAGPVSSKSRPSSAGPDSPENKSGPSPHRVASAQSRKPPSPTSRSGSSTSKSPTSAVSRNVHGDSDTTEKEDEKDNELSRDNCDSGVMLEDLEEYESDMSADDVPLPPMSSRGPSRASSWNQPVPAKPAKSTQSWSAGDKLPQKASTPEDVRMFNNMQSQRRLAVIGNMKSSVRGLQEKEYDDSRRRKEQRRIDEQRRERERDLRHRSLAMRGYIPAAKESVGWKLAKNLQELKGDEKTLSQMLKEAMEDRHRRNAENKGRTATSVAPKEVSRSNSNLSPASVSCDADKKDKPEKKEHTVLDIERE